MDNNEVTYEEFWNNLVMHMGDVKTALQWMNIPMKYLNGRKPIDCLDEPIKINGALEAMASGAFL